MKFAAAVVLAAAAGVSASYKGNVTVVTETVDVFTTYCPGPTTITQGTKVYTVTEVRRLVVMAVFGPRRPADEECCGRMQAGGGGFASRPMLGGSGARGATLMRPLPLASPGMGSRQAPRLGRIGRVSLTGLTSPRR